MPRERFLRTLRALAECYQAFGRLSASHVRELGLTPAQFDIVATLGNTEGLSCKALGEMTLITKGTLTGIIDRLEARGIVERLPDPDDGRGTLVRLTRRGEALFRRTYPAHVAFLKPAFGHVPEADLVALERILGGLQGRFVRERRMRSRIRRAVDGGASERAPRNKQ